MMSSRVLRFPRLHRALEVAFVFLLHQGRGAGGQRVPRPHQARRLSTMMLVLPVAESQLVLAPLLRVREVPHEVHRRHSTRVLVLRQLGQARLEQRLVSDVAHELSVGDLGMRESQMPLEIPYS